MWCEGLNGSAAFTAKAFACVHWPCLVATASPYLEIGFGCMYSNDRKGILSLNEIKCAHIIYKYCCCELTDDDRCSYYFVERCEYEGPLLDPQFYCYSSINDDVIEIHMHAIS